MTQKPLDENYNDGWQTENSAAYDPYKCGVSILPVKDFLDLAKTGEVPTLPQPSSTIISSGSYKCTFR